MSQFLSLLFYTLNYFPKGVFIDAVAVMGVLESRIKDICVFL